MYHQDDPEAVRRAREQIRARMAGYPGPIAYAAEPPPGSSARWGAEHKDDQAYCAKGEYLDEHGGVWLIIRTLRPPADPPPVIGTIEDMYTALLGFRSAVRRRADSAARRNDPRGPRAHPPRAEEMRAAFQAARADDERTPERSGEICIDGTPFPLRRKDFDDCSVIEVQWTPGKAGIQGTQGMRVWCAGSARAIDGLALCSADRMPESGPAGRDAAKPGADKVDRTLIYREPGQQAKPWPDREDLP